MDKIVMINELKKDIEGLLEIKQQMIRALGENHKNVSLIDKSIEALKTEVLTKLHIYALKESVKNKKRCEDSFDAEELIDFLENIFNEEARNFSESNECISLDEEERDM